MGRLVTTHAGSLPRPAELDGLWAKYSRGVAVDGAELTAAVEAATEAALAQQRDAGIDIVNDGEQGRESFFTFVRDRLDGFGPELGDQRGFRDLFEFPSYVARKLPEYTKEAAVSLGQLPACTGPVVWRGPAALDAELARLGEASADAAFRAVFVTSPSPGIVAAAMSNRHYPALGDYVDALAAELANEYRRIVDAGFLLQIDAPDLGMERHTLFANAPLEEFLTFAERVVAAINTAVAGLPAERVRLHVCWGNYDGPHCYDVPLADIASVVGQARVGSIMLALANPRHAHEVSLLSSPHLARFDVVAGVIDTTSNYVEHPEVVADRLVRAVEVVGDPARVQAGTDCGFATAAGFGDVASEVVWLKLRSLVEGAALASRRLGL